MKKLLIITILAITIGACANLEVPEEGADGAQDTSAFFDCGC